MRGGRPAWIAEAGLGVASGRTTPAAALRYELCETNPIVEVSFEFWNGLEVRGPVACCALQWLASI
jgi:hypothetical protein